MNIYPYQDCCKQAAIKAYNQGLFYPVVCDSCGNFFSITDELDLLIKQGIAHYTIKAITANFDLVIYDGNIIFLLPGKEPGDLYTRVEIEEIVVMERLHLYNRELSYGAQAIYRVMQQKGVRPLPSVTTINRILSRNYLTHRRTGYYPEDYC